MCFLRTLTMLIFAFSSLTLVANDDELKVLDSYVSHRAMYMEKKQVRIQQVKRQLQKGISAEEQLRVYNKIFGEYYTLNFDSAKAYIDKGLQFARLHNNQLYIDNFTIHRGLLLATGGYYSQAEAVLKSIDAEHLHPSLLFNYYYSMTWLYNFWSAYCHDNEFSPIYNQLRMQYLDKTIANVQAGSAMYNYLMGEKYYYGGLSAAKSLAYYQKVLKQVPITDRLYASSAYAIARGYKSMKKMDLYESYLIKAAISDQVCPLKENLALQELSLYLYEKDSKYSGRAVTYIYCSMEDAQFYNNRLRMLEISHILPRIVATYQTQINQRTTIIYWALGGLSLFAVVLLMMIVLALKQNKKLNQRRLEMREQNELLEKLNQQLSNTNKHRETYLRLFLDISAVYINKLDALRKMVTRSIKAGTTNDLLQKINRVRVVEEDASMFYNRFDRAFLILYPDFVKQLNSLLREDAQIQPQNENSLTTELRIFALMRLGVTASSEIATLLFYSTQTIYNYKTQMKNKAKVRETFEQDVNRLCHILPNEVMK